MIVSLKITNPKLLVLEELALLVENPATPTELKERITKHLSVERYQVIADANSKYHRAVWHTTLRFVVYNQYKFGPVVRARIRKHITASLSNTRRF